MSTSIPQGDCDSHAEIKTRFFVWDIQMKPLLRLFAKASDIDPQLNPVIAAYLNHENEPVEEKPARSSKKRSHAEIDDEVEVVGPTTTPVQRDPEENVDLAFNPRFVPLTSFKVSGRICAPDFVPPRKRFGTAWQELDKKKSFLVDWMAAQLAKEISLPGEFHVTPSNDSRHEFRVAIRNSICLLDQGAFEKPTFQGSESIAQINAGFKQPVDWRSSLIKIVNSERAGGAIRLTASITLSPITLREDPTKFPHVPLFRSSNLYEDVKDQDKPRVKMSINYKVFVDKEKIVHLHPSLHEPARHLFHCLFPLTNMPGMPSLHRMNLETFYSNLKSAPEITPSEYNSLQPAEMKVNLLPFQKRTLAFLINRERHALEDEPSEVDQDPEGVWERIMIGGDDGFAVAFSRLTGQILPLPDTVQYSIPLCKGGVSSLDVKREEVDELSGTERQDVRSWVLPAAHALALQNIKGTMLCEEMGLGKTVETIALICKNPCPVIRPHHELDVSSLTVDRPMSVRATLIVCPPALFDQWVAEIGKHAPTLRVITYPGWKSLYNNSKNHGTIQDWVSKADSADIVVTTTDVLSADLDVVRDQKERSRRSNIEYHFQERKKSALVILQWWRVVMDEVQMLGLESATNAALTISRIPRRLSLAISGTPAKTEVSNLIGSLRFLGSFISQKIWDRLLQGPFAIAFEKTFDRIAIRTTKDEIVHELQIPKQTRTLVPISLNQIEIEYYRDTLRRLLQYLGIDDEGYPIAERWKMDVVKLRSAFHALRMVCDHVSAGQKLLRAVGGGHVVHGKRVSTLTEALDQLIQSAERQYWSTDLARMKLHIRKAILQQGAMSIPYSSVDGIRIEQILLQVEKEVDDGLSAIRSELSELLDVQVLPRDSLAETDIGDPKPTEDERNSSKRSMWRNRLREHLLLRHQVVFRLGDLYHRIVRPDGTENDPREDAKYAEAVLIRKGLMKESHSRVQTTSAEVQRLSHTGNALTSLDELHLTTPDDATHTDLPPFQDWTAIVEILNRNGDMLWNCRGKVWEILAERVDEDIDNPSGQEYDHFLNRQATVDAYMTAYMAALSDRRHFLTEQRTVVVDEVRKKRSTRTAKQTMEIGDEADQRAIGDPQLNEGDVGVDPKVLEENLLSERNDLRARARKPLNAVSIQFREKARHQMDGQERSNILNYVQAIYQDLKEQLRIIDQLEKELDTLRKAFNSRVTYFGILQEVSDTVVEVDFGDSLHSDIVDTSEEIKLAEREVALARARIRYLQSVANPGQEDEEKSCIICLDRLKDVKKGVLLDCGHQYCEPCFKSMKMTSLSNRCQICRAPIDRSSYNVVTYDVNLNNVRIKVEDDAESADVLSTELMVPRDGVNILEDLTEINDMHLRGDWGSKVSDDCCRVELCRLLTT